MPDVDLIIATADLSAAEHGHAGPIFAQAKRLEHTAAVLFPDHTFIDWHEADTRCSQNTTSKSHDQRTGKAAVLVMKQSTMFSDQFLGLAYDLLKSDHFSIQHESVIRKLVKACIEDSNKSESTTPPATEKEQTKAAEHRGLMDKLVTCTAPQQHQQYSRAYIIAKPPWGAVGGDCAPAIQGLLHMKVLSNIPSTRQLGPPLRLWLAFSLSGGSCCPSGTGTSAVTLWPVYMPGVVRKLVTAWLPAVAYRATAVMPSLGKVHCLLLAGLYCPASTFLQHIPEAGLPRQAEGQILRQGPARIHQNDVHETRHTGGLQARQCTHSSPQSSSVHIHFV
ncbi:hypothetical protein WJX77_002718 [Trebouxia sp. C0004]